MKQKPLIMKKRVILMGVALLTALSLSAQPQLGAWNSLAVKADVTGIDHDANYVYVSTADDGVVQIDKLTGEQQCLNRSNGKSHVSNLSSIRVHGGDIWLMGQEGGIGCWHDGQLSVYDDCFFTGQYMKGIAFDGDNVWVADKYLYRMKNGTVESTFVVHSELDSYVEDLAIDQSGTVWAGGFDAGGEYFLNKVEDGNLETVAFPYGSIHAIKVGADKVLWMASEGGLVRYENGEFQVLNNSNSNLPRKAVKTLAITQDGDVWTAVDDCLCHYEGDGTFTIYKDTRLQYVKCIDTDGDELFVGTTNGLYRFENGSFEPVSLLGALSESLGSDIYFNPAAEAVAKGLVWIATNKGITAYDMDKGTAEALPVNGETKWMRTDCEGHVWIGQNVGSAGMKVKRLDENGGTLTEVKAFPSQVNAVYDMEIASDLTLWAATNNGVYHYTGTQWKQESGINAPGNRSMGQIEIDGNGNVWAGSNDRGGLFRRSEGVWTYYSLDANSVYNTIVGMKAAADGFLWISCGEYQKSKLVKFDGSTMTKIDGGLFKQIEVDVDGNVWGVSKSGYGAISVYDGNGWTKIDTSNSGISSNSVSGIKLDYSNGCVWVFHGMYNQRTVSVVEVDWQNAPHGAVVNPDDNSDTSVKAIETTTDAKTVYAVDGTLRSSIANGVNIVKMANGEVRKVMGGKK